jgi:molybdopterin/thiamine biosynthesis adenylyltransferase
LQAITWPVGDEKWSTLINDAEDRGQILRPPAADFMNWRVPVSVTLLTGNAKPASDLGRAAFAQAFGRSLSEEELKGTRLFVVVNDFDVRTFYSSDAETIVSRPWVELPHEANMRADRAVETYAKKVALVGLGSVGSKVAEILARADTRHMVLVDGDVMLPGNIERHILDWRDVGVRKVEGVTRRLLQIAPHIDITKAPGNLNWQVSAKGQASRMDAIAGCDLIIDATGDPATTLMLGAVAHANGRAFLTASVFEGGLGCVIARSIPGRDPTFADGREGYLGYCRDVDVEPPKCGTRRYESLNDDGRPIVADDAAVTITAGHVGRIALDILDNRVGPDETAWLLLGFRKGWLFHRHGHAIAVDVGGPVPPATVEDSEAQSFALALVKEALDAAKAAE